MFMTWSFFFTVTNKWEQKYRVPDTCYKNNVKIAILNIAMLNIAIEILKSLCRLHGIRHNAKSAERQKTSFPKESVENVDLYKPVLNKIMTTHD